MVTLYCKMDEGEGKSKPNSGEIGELVDCAWWCTHRWKGGGLGWWRSKRYSSRESYRLVWELASATACNSKKQHERE